MKTNWQTKKLDEVTFFQEGPGIRKYEYKKNGYPIINVRCVQDGFIDLSKSQAVDPKFIKEKWEHFQVEENDILFTTSGSIGRTAMVKKKDLPLLMNTSVVRFKSLDSKELDKYFLAWLLRSPNFIDEVKSYSSGTAQKNVGPTHLKMISISFPPFPEQHRIVKILDEVFADVAKAKENAGKNLQNSKDLFESYLQSVFSKPSKEWGEKKLGDKNLFQIIDGDRGKNYPKKSDFLNNGHCLFLNTKNVRPDGFDFRTTMFITEKKDNTLGNGKLQRNDVLLTTRGTIGNIAVYDENVPFKNIRINSGMLIFRPNITLIIPEYLFAIFQSGIMKTQIKKYVSGAAQPQLPIKTLVNFSIPVPKSLSEQKSIVAKLDTLSAETRKLETIYQQKLADLEELKKSVLKKVFNGEP